jgi:hypothetical protein
MSEPSKHGAIGEFLREQVDPSVDADEHRLERVRFVEAAQQGRRLPVRPVRGWAWAAAVTVTALLVVGVWRLTERPDLVRFTVGPEASEGQVGVYIAPVASHPLPVQFSDGSTLRVHPASRVRVAETTSQGAAISLEAGRVDVEVNKAGGGAWSVVAGPYRVRVTGTKFDVSWMPDVGHAQVWVREGVVVVSGPSVEAGVEVRAGEHFSSRSHTTVKPTATASTAMQPGPMPGAEEVEPRVPVPSLSGERATEPTVPEPAVSADEAVPPPTWDQLASRGDYAEIVRQAEERGVESILATGSASELHALSQAARFSGKGQLGHRCLVQLRQRHPQSSQARSAAFVLGRMADQGGQSASALQWYDTYLAESPGGALAAEAHGRRMALLHRMGRTPEAEAAARSYLDAYPKGGYAPVAKDILGL